MPDMLKRASVIATVALFSIAGAAQAATYTVGFNSSSGSYQYNDGNNTLSVTGLAAKNNSNIAVKNLEYYSGSGLGVQGNGHGISNSSIFTPVYEAVLLDFGQAVSLDTLNIGWKGLDSDASILAYTGTDFRSVLNAYSSGLQWNQLSGLGFTTIPDASKGYDLAAGANDVSSSLVSQYWLVGAYNSVFGGGTNWLSDSFKLAGVSFSTFDTVETPIPAALGLFLTGLAGMGWLRRRKSVQLTAA